MAEGAHDGPRETVKQELERAIRDGRITVSLQTVCDTNRPEIALYEKCVPRWLRDDGQQVGPDEFIPTLEMADAIHLLDQHVLLSALHELESSPHIVLGCNVAPLTLGSSQHWKSIIHILSAHHDLASRVVLEFTEVQPMGNSWCVFERLAMARELGCKIAVGNFGVGLLSPGVLLKFDIDIVKIDASFLRDIRTCVDGRSTLHHIICFVSGVAPVVVMEGVELASHRAKASAAGATHFQGLVMSRRLGSTTLITEAATTGLPVKAGAKTKKTRGYKPAKSPQFTSS